MTTIVNGSLLRSSAERRFTHTQQRVVYKLCCVLVGGLYNNDWSRAVNSARLDTCSRLRWRDSPVEQPEKERCDMGRQCSVIGCCFLTVAMFVFLCVSRPAQAEWYVAGQGGGTFGGGFHKLNESSPGANNSIENLTLHTSPLYGGKVGYYIDDPAWQWLGFEMEAYSSTQHVNQQSFGIGSVNPTSVQVTSGKDVRVTTWAPVTIMVRYQIGSLEPYGGVGLGVYFLHLHDAASNITANSNANMGLIAKAGLRWRMTKHLAVFAEWKYNQVDFDVNNFPIGSLSGAVSGTYQSQFAVGGLGWHF